MDSNSRLDQHLPRLACVQQRPALRPAASDEPSRQPHCCHLARARRTSPGSWAMPAHATWACGLAIPRLALCPSRAPRATAANPCAPPPSIDPVESSGLQLQPIPSTTCVIPSPPLPIASYATISDKRERGDSTFSRQATAVPVLFSGGSSSLSTLGVAGGRGVAGISTWICIAVA